MQYMQNRTARKPTISLRVHPKLLAEVDDLVGRTRMKSRTEFLERAIEAYVQDIRDSKVVIVKSWTEPKARAAVGKNLVAVGRKISKVHLIAQTSAHRAQAVYVWGKPARCFVDIPIRLRS